MPLQEKFKQISILSPYFTLPPLEDILGDDADLSRPEVNQLIDKKLHILSDIDGKVFLINPTIKAFLESFREPKTLDEVIEEFAAKSKTQKDQIEEAMYSFYKDMFDKGILIPEEAIPQYHEMMDEVTINTAMYKNGDVIGRFEVIEELVIKNASQLYLALDPILNETVVIKTMIYPDIIPEKVKNRSWKKFVQEFELMESLGEHPNICKLIDLDQSGINPFAAIEHIKGQSIRSYISNNKLSIDEKLRLIKELISAIAHVQSKKVVHGDIHLSNFLVNENKVIKLIDFGLSNNAEMKDGEIKRNGGVYHCIPPERVKIGPFSFLSQRADFRSEVFQLGIIAYYILYGEYPFLGFTWKELAENILYQDLELSQFTVEGDPIPEYYLQLLTKAFQKDPKSRFPDALHMISFLDK